MHDRTTHGTLFNPFEIHDFVRSVHLDARMIPPRCGIKCGDFYACFSCNKLHATGALFHIVACILMHDRITHGTLFTTFRAFTISCVACILMHDRLPSRAFLFVQQVARYGSVIPYCSVQLVARPNHARNVIQPFRVFTISCNELHATGFTGVHYFLKRCMLIIVSYDELC